MTTPSPKNWAVTGVGAARAMAARARAVGRAKALERARALQGRESGHGGVVRVVREGDWRGVITVGSGWGGGQGARWSPILPEPSPRTAPR